MRILFICTGNTCRSPMAAGYFRLLLAKRGRAGVEVLSAGTFAGAGQPASPAAVASMRQQGVDLDAHRSVPLTPELLRDADLIVTMTASHRRLVGAVSPSALAKTRDLLSFGADGAVRASDVPDPFGGDREAYAACFAEMRPALEALCERLDEVLGEVRGCAPPGAVARDG